MVFFPIISWSSQRLRPPFVKVGPIPCSLLTTACFFWLRTRCRVASTQKWSPPVTFKVWIECGPVQVGINSRWPRQACVDSVSQRVNSGSRSRIHANATRIQPGIVTHLVELWCHEVLLTSGLSGELCVLPQSSSYHHYCCSKQIKRMFLHFVRASRILSFCFQSHKDFEKDNIDVAQSLYVYILSVCLSVSVRRQPFLRHQWSDGYQIWHSDCLRHEKCTTFNCFDLDLHSMSHRS